AQNIAAKVVGTQPMTATRALHGGRVILQIRIVWRDLRCEERHEYNEKQQHQAKHGEQILPESSPRICPQIALLGHRFEGGGSSCHRNLPWCPAMSTESADQPLHTGDRRRD